ncbi:hypothetical protein [Anaplasma platys]|uniref:hypothetical protein n=1 Tax=Anaplasma platys TaxID=949 RepID=UPI00145D461B|nr:hypothetical protein [Anaplasma platys]
MPLGQNYVLEVCECGHDQGAAKTSTDPVKSKVGNYTARGWPGSIVSNTDTAEEMAKELWTLNRNEKGKVASPL